MYSANRRLSGTTFFFNLGVVLADQFAPFGIPAELFEWHEVEVSQGTGILVWMHRFFDVLVSPFAFLASHQIADDPPRWRLGLFSVTLKCSFPDWPTDTAEYATAIAVGATGHFRQRAIIERSFTHFNVVSNQFFATEPRPE
jgi:hypothetical protein